MKKLFLMILACAALFFSCEKEPATPPHIVPDPVLSVDVDEVYLYPAALNVAKDIAFSFKDIEPAAAITAEGGSGVDVKVSLDIEKGVGVAAVTVKESFSGEGALVIRVANDAEHTVSVSVSLKLISVTVSTSKMEFPKEGAVGVFNVSTNVSYTVVSSVVWATVEKTADGRWSVTVNANEVKADKQGVIIILDAEGVKIASFPISQEAATQTPNEKSELETILAIEYQTRSKENNLKFIDEHKESLVGLLPASSLMTINGETHVVSLTLYRDHPGPVPVEVGDLKYLRQLIIQGENFNGELPENLGNLKDLRDFAVMETNISGEIPEFISGFSKLIILTLQYNYFTGNLPVWLAEMPALETMQFSINCLDGQIDPKILETKWWNAICEGGYVGDVNCIGMKMGETQLLMGQREGHKLWI